MLVEQIHWHIANTKETHHVVHAPRIDGKKTKVPYARSEFRLLQIMENVCDERPLSARPHLPPDSDAAPPEVRGASTKRVVDACHRLVDAHQVEFVAALRTPQPRAKARLCTDIAQGTASGRVALFFILLLVC